MNFRAMHPGMKRSAISTGSHDGRPASQSTKAIVDTAKTQYDMVITIFFIRTFIIITLQNYQLYLYCTFKNHVKSPFYGI